MVERRGRICGVEGNRFSVIRRPADFRASLCESRQFQAQGSIDRNNLLGTFRAAFSDVAR
jgi:hypothetical protein